jgi:hypothetical protein
MLNSPQEPVSAICKDVSFFKHGGQFGFTARKEGAEDGFRALPPLIDVRVSVDSPIKLSRVVHQCVSPPSLSSVSKQLR